MRTPIIDGSALILKSRSGQIMVAKWIILGFLLFSGPRASAQSASRGSDLPKFMGREITVIEPERQDDFPDGGPPFPKGPASVCVEGAPRRQCYTMPADGNFPFGNNPTVTVVQLERDLPAILFSAATGGVSGWEIHYSLLQPGTANALDDLFVPGISLSNQSQHAFWSDSAVSDARIFVTAEAVWGPDESHYGEHRYMISAYVLAPSSFDLHRYYLEDRYMTVRRYDSEKADVLASEKREILARLRRVKAGVKPLQQ
jgi:hypothetical protein